MPSVFHMGNIRIKLAYPAIPTLSIYSHTNLLSLRLTKGKLHSRVDEVARRNRPAAIVLRRRHRCQLE